MSAKLSTRSGWFCVNCTLLLHPIELPDTCALSMHSASMKSLMNSTWLSVPNLGQYSSRVSACPNPGMSGQYTRKPFAPRKGAMKRNPAVPDEPLMPPCSSTTAGPVSPAVT